MSIQTELQRLQGDKAAMKAAIEEKGVTVGDVSLDDYAEKIAAIEQGGGGGLALDDIADWVDDDTSFGELTYLQNTYAEKLTWSKQGGTGGVYGTVKVALVDEAKAIAWIKATAPTWDTVLRQNILYENGKLHYYDEQGGGEVVFTSWEDPQIEATTGFKFLEFTNYWGNGLVTSIDHISTGKTEVAYKIKTLQDLKNVFQWRNDERWSMDEDVLPFSDGTEINRNDVVGFKFGKICNKPEYEADLTAINYMFGPYGFNSVKHIGALPKWTKTIGGNNSIGLYSMQGLNSDLILSNLDQSAETEYGAYNFFNYMPNFNSRIYIFGAWNSGADQYHTEFRDLHKMCSTVYWAQDPISIDSNAFSVNKNTYDAYVKGIKFAGPGAAKAKQLLPDLNGTGGRYRKIILAE